ncbi:MAG: glycoside hydrolase family 5 protein [Chitinivibrionales bacterium]
MKQPSTTPPSLRFGTNISHWLSQSSLSREVLRSWFKEDDIRRIADWGMDHIRLPVDYPLLENDGFTGHFNMEGFGWIEKAIDWCDRHGLNMILDMHCLPGHHFQHEYLEYNTIWDSDSPHRRRSVNIWKFLAHSVQAPHVVFELLNEPVAPVDEQWNSLADQLHRAIREQNKTQWIMIGSNRWNHAHTFRTLHPVDDPAIMYTFHLYEPFLFTHQNAEWVPEMRLLHGDTVPYPGPFDHPILQNDSSNPIRYDFMSAQPYGYSFLERIIEPVIDFQKLNNVRCYCGEFGCISYAPAADKLRWYKDICRLFSNHGIGFSNWNYRSDNFGIVTSKNTIDTATIKTMRQAAGL